MKAHPKLIPTSLKIYLIINKVFRSDVKCLLFGVGWGTNNLQFVASIQIVLIEILSLMNKVRVHNKNKTHVK